MVTMGVAISNHQRECYIDFDICHETATSNPYMQPNNNHEGVGPGEDIMLDIASNKQHEVVRPGEDIEHALQECKTMNMNDDDESNAWNLPNDKCSEGSSYVSDEDVDVPCLPLMNMML